MPNETALKDGNRVPTLLFESGGEVRRVSPLNPLPVTTSQDGTVLSESREQTGVGAPTMVTPAAGKRLIIKGMSATLESATGGEAGIRFSGGKVLHKVYRGDQAGSFMNCNFIGAVDESLVVFTAGISAGQRAFFIVNYLEV